MSSSFDDFLSQNSNLSQSSLDSNSPETPTFGQNFHTNDTFAPHPFTQTYQTDHFSTENHLNDAFHCHTGEHASQTVSYNTDNNVDLYSNHDGNHQNFDPAHPGGDVVGNPGHEMQFWHKESFNDCDVVAQQMGLESLTARHFSESALLHEAIQDGSYLATGGTPADYIGHLYETHGFPIERHHDATIDELKEKLAEGQKVEVAVNSQILWANELQVAEFGSLPANHSVEVIGIVYPDHDSEHPEVILNDPGIDNGRGIMVPLEQFEKAWAASQYLMATTHLPDVHTVLRDSYDDMARADLLTNRNSLGVPSDPSQLEIAAQQRAQAMREREASLQREREIERERTQQLAREQQVREEEARREQLREEQRREEALREQQQREREQQQREEQQRAEQLKEEHRREERQREEQQRAQQNQNN